MYDDKTKRKMGNKVQEGAESLKTYSKQKKKKRNNFNKRYGSSKLSRNVRAGVTFNDVGYYTKNKSITDAFAKLPFNFIIGGGLAGQDATVAVPTTTLISFIVDWFQGVTAEGATQTNQTRSILDQVATILYTRMRRANSGATNNIEYVDPLISNLAASIDILANAVSMKRVFRFANSFSWKNRLLPKEIFLELGIDYDDFIANQAAYRGKFNTLVALARTIRTLKDYPFVNAICAEFENLFKDEDADTGREQLYLPIKGFHHIYDAVGTEHNPGGMVRLVTVADIGMDSDPTKADAVVYTGPVGNEDLTIRKFSLDLKILEAQIYALINDSDFNLVQADIEKAFGEQSAYMVMDKVDENVEPLVPIFSGEFAHMFANGKFYSNNFLDIVNFGDDSNGDCYCVKNNAYVNVLYQDHDATGAVKLRSWIHLKGKSEQVDTYANGGFINSNEIDPSVDDVIIATRYQSLFSLAVNSDVPEDFRYTGTLPTDQNIYFGDAMANFICFGGRIRRLTYVGGKVIGTTRLSWFNTGKYSNTTQLLQVLCGFMQCGIAPMFMDVTSLSSFSNPIGLFGKINNIRFVSKSELRPIHESVFLSLWNLPENTNL